MGRGEKFCLWRINSLEKMMRDCEPLLFIFFKIVFENKFLIIQKILFLCFMKTCLDFVLCFS